jgi:quercetin dioxygenase-like cupin family protein
MVVKSLYPTEEGVAVSSDVTQTISVGRLGIRFVVDAEQSGGAVTVFECHVPADAKMPAPHSHDGFEETIYGLEGVTTWTIEGELVEIGPGDGVCIPRGTIHGFDNRGNADATFLAVATPGVFGPAYFHEIGGILAGDGPPDRAAIAEVMRRHGLTPA